MSSIIDFLKSVIQGAGIVILFVAAATSFLAYYLAIPFLILVVIGMFVIRPCMKGRKENFFKTLISLCKFFIVATFKLAIFGLTAAVAGVAFYFGFGIMRIGTKEAAFLFPIYFILGAAMMTAGAWIIYSYGRVCFTTLNIGGSSFTVNPLHGFTEALCGRY